MYTKSVAEICGSYIFMAGERRGAFNTLCTSAHLVWGPPPPHAPAHRKFSWPKSIFQKNEVVHLGNLPTAVVLR